VHQTCTLIASLGKAHFNAKFKRMSWEGVCKWDLKKSFGSEMDDAMYLKNTLEMPF
jgi:hypothetical protein